MPGRWSPATTSRATALDVRPLTPTIGAEIRGVDCSQPVGDDVIAEIRRLWLRWLVVFFPDQQCTDEQQMAFAQRFGELSVGHPVEPTLADLPEVQPIDSLKDRTNFWHTDVTFMARPPAGSMLRAITVPDVGGDTMWCDTRAAYEALAEPLRTFCDGLSAWHYDEYYAAVIANGDANEWDGVKLDRLVPARHPVVRVHPETQRPNLFVNPKFTVGLHDFPVEQSRSVLAYAVRAHDPAAVHRPLPLEAGHDRVLGQPRHDALRRLRLRRHAPDHASRDPPRRRAGRTFVGSLRTS